MKIKLGLLLIMGINYLVYASDTADWTEIGTPTAMIGENANNRAGYSVAISSNGQTVAIGEPGWNGFSGRVRVYKFNGTNWVVLGTATAMQGQAANNQAGNSVGISSDGQTVAVGEPGWNLVGRVRVYRFDGTDWVAVGTSTAMVGQAAGDQAGYSVGISSDGQAVAVGEPFWDGVGSASGRVRVYRFNGTDWVAVGTATAMQGQAAGDQAGYSVGIISDGLTVAFGEPFWDGVGNNSGRVRVYRFNGTDWVALGTATAMQGQAAGDRAGDSVGISSDGQTVAFGEPFWDGVGNASGRVRVYKFNGTDWVALGTATAMQGQAAGNSAGDSVGISSDGQTVAFGEPFWNGVGSASGRVRVYQFDGTDWIAVGTATAMQGQASDDLAGYSVGISSDGQTVAVGEPFWNGVGNDSGLVRVYQYPSAEVQNVVDIVNQNIAQVSYHDITQALTPGAPTDVSSPGQGAIIYGANISVRLNNVSVLNHNIFNQGQ